MKRITLFLFCVLSLHQSQASETLASNDLWTAVAKAKALATQFGGAEYVLFVTDLDNTLLKSKQDLGGEPWFLWQNALLAQEDSEYRVACNFQDLISINRVTMQLTQYDPVQPDQHEAIREMQRAGIATMALTSRGVDIASATFHQLMANRIDFAKARPPGAGIPTEPFLPYDLSNPEAAGLRKDDLVRLGVKTVSPVLYHRGVLFGEGQHKGALLRSFLYRTGSKVKAVVFWDNEQRNNDRVVDGLARTPIFVSAIRASRQDEDIRRFENAKKGPVTTAFLDLRNVLSQVFAYARPCQLPMDGKM